jgi:hypothetical protein
VSRSPLDEAMAELFPASIRGRPAQWLLLGYEGESERAIDSLLECKVKLGIIVL